MPLMPPTPAGATPAAYLARTMHLSPGDYRLVRADLNDDGRAEAIVYVTKSSYCGSGGCDMVVLTPSSGGWRRVAKTTITRPPIALLPEIHHGWHDLSVTVVGGGILTAYRARLRFDGRRYASNPTVPPAEPMEGPGRGRVLIAR